MNQAEVTYHLPVRGFHGFAVYNAINAIVSSHTSELQPHLFVFKQLPDIHLAHAARFQSQNIWYMLSLSSQASRRSRNAASLNIHASSPRICRCKSVANSGTSNTKISVTGCPSGESNGIG